MHTTETGLAVVERPFVVPTAATIEPVHDEKFREALLDITGFDLGTSERADVVYQTLDGADLNRMWDEFQRTLDIREEQEDNLINYLTYTVTDPIEQVRYPTLENFEEASEYGEPHGIRLPAPYNMGFDFRWYDLAIRYTWQFVLDASQRQIEELHNEAMEADTRLLFNKVFKVVFNPLDVTSSIRNIPVTVYKWWNGDGIAPPQYKNFTFDGSHNHFITSGTASLTSAGVQSMETTLYHHGYNLVNGYSMVLLMNRQEGLILRGARVTGGWQYDFIPGPAYGGQIFLPAALGISGGPIPLADLGALSGQQIGQYGPFHVIEEDFVPPGYVVALVTRGPENLGNPVGIREHQNASARGLKLLGGDNDYPLIDSFYRHGFGAGVRHRGAGVTMQVTTSGTYTTPTAYA